MYAQNNLYQHLMESIDTDDDEMLCELTRESEEVSRKVSKKKTGGKKKTCKCTKEPHKSV